MTVDQEIEQAKREVFGDRAGFATTQVVGSGISQVTRISLSIEPANAKLIGEMALPWTENRDMIQRVFGPLLERSRRCPGRDQPQCCRAKANQMCAPNWREGEDLEWYAQQINVYLTRLNNKILQQGDLAPAMAADEAFELGRLFTEALNKKHPNITSGVKVTAGGLKGAAIRKAQKLLRKAPEDTVRAIDKLFLADRRLKKSEAYRREAKEQGVNEQTIRKEYCSAKKTCGKPC
jgi:hypothetical protein